MYRLALFRVCAEFLGVYVNIVLLVILFTSFFNRKSIDTVERKVWIIMKFTLKIVFSTLLEHISSNTLAALSAYTFNFLTLPFNFNYSLKNLIIIDESLFSFKVSELLEPSCFLLLYFFISRVSFDIIKSPRY